MKICDPSAERFCDEREILEALLPFEGSDVLELGCGKAEKTRMIAGAGGAHRSPRWRWTASSTPRT